MRQYHEEREGKNVKFQEYYLGKWSEEKTELAKKTWELERKADGKPKYKTLKIDNTRYPYFEMEFTDGTMCDIIDAPRTTMVRYVCYPHGKDDIYSLKETSSCNYEAIILTSSLCAIPAFHAEETKEISIKCFNSQTEPHKPISMLRQELSEWEESENDLLVSKESKAPAKLWSKTDGDMVTFKYSGDVDKIILELMANSDIDVENEYQHLISRSAQGTTPPPLNDLTPIKEFISGKNCLTGVSNSKHPQYLHVLIPLPCRAPAGGSTNSVMAGMCVNSIRIKIAKSNCFWAISLRNRIACGPARIPIKVHVVQASLHPYGITMRRAHTAIAAVCHARWTLS